MPSVLSVLKITCMIRETEVRFLLRLHHNSVFIFFIWMVDWQKVGGPAASSCGSDDSDAIALRTQQIVSMDTKTGSPINPPDEEEEVETQFNMQQVKSIGLDQDEYVNNVIYADYAGVRVSGHEHPYTRRPQKWFH